MLKGFVTHDITVKLFRIRVSKRFLTNKAPTNIEELFFTDTGVTPL